jgi:FkbM family methyltransferase
VPGVTLAGLRLRGGILASRVAARTLRAVGLRDRIVDRRRKRARAARAAEEAIGSDRLSRPALHGLDGKLDRLLDRDGGYYVEAGSHDGYTQSNTYYLARFRGWRGVLVEPTPTLYALCVAERPESTVVQAALVDHESDGKPVTIRFGDLMSTVAGAREDERDWTALGLQTGWRDAYEATVPGRSLSAILEEAGAPEIDLLSLDVEGFEAPALRGIDFTRHAPRWIAIEAHDETKDRPPIDDVLGELYVCHGRITPTDLLYRRADVPEPAALAGVLL